MARSSSLATFGVVLLASVLYSTALVADEPRQGSIVTWGVKTVGVDLSGGFVDIAAGTDHVLGVKADGSIVGWGVDSLGNTEVPGPNTGFVGAAGGGFHSLGLRADGSVVGWGSNHYGQAASPQPNTGFVAVAAGRFHSLGLKRDGSIVGWGFAGHGQIDIPTPNTGFVAVAAGDYHSLGLKTDGSIVAWGCGQYGTVVTDYGQCTVPTPNTGFAAIAAGAYHNLALRTDGSIVAWGRNDLGQATVPEPNTGFLAVAAGFHHNLALRADGSIVAWGQNDSGETDVPAPNTDFVAVAAGNDQYGSFSAGLKADGSIVAWGANRYGQTNMPLPNEGYVAVDGDLGLKADGSVVWWGVDTYGQDQLPVPNRDFVAIAAGGRHCLALKPDGSIVGWGEDGPSDVTRVPWGIENRDFVAIGAEDGSIALRADGSILYWGDIKYSLGNVPEPNTGFVAFSTTGPHILGLKSDGSVVAWGNNDYGQTDVPEPNADFVAVATAPYHSLGLKSDGSVVAWGRNTSGQTDVPQPNTNFIAIAAGSSSSMGLKSDGTVVVWGNNEYGQYEIPDPNAGFIAINAKRSVLTGIRTKQEGPCCLPGSGCQVMAVADCQAAGGIFGEGDACLGEAACCLGGTCAMADRACCAARGGLPRAAGSSCTAGLCSRPWIGSCCLRDGPCVMTSQGDCVARNGAFTGGSSCAPDLCPAPSGPWLAMIAAEPQATQTSSYPSGTAGVGSGTFRGVSPGQTIWFEIHAGGWEPSLLSTVQWMLDAASLDSSSVGAAPLQVYRPACASDGDCEEQIGVGTGSECGPGPRPADECSPAFQQADRADFIMPGGLAACAVADDNLSCGVTKWEGGVEDPVATSAYLGTWTLHVPWDAAGTYVLEFEHDPLLSFFVDSEQNELPIAAMHAGIVHVGPPDLHATPGRTVSVDISGMKGPSLSGAGSKTAIRATLATLYDPSICPPRGAELSDLSAFEGQVRWLGPPSAFPEGGSSDSYFLAAQLQCCPHFRDWSAGALAAEFPDTDVSTVHAFGAEVVPCSTYLLQTADLSCLDLSDEGCYGSSAIVRTGLWGDVWEPYGSVNFVDIAKIVEAFKGIAYDAGPPESGAPPKARAMLRGNVPPLSEPVGFMDISKAVNAYRSLPYAELGPTNCGPCN